MGVRGSFLIDRWDSVHIPGFDLELIDPTRFAGAFAGALAASCGAGDEPREAVRFAGAAGALAGARFGLQESLPRKEEIIELLQNQPE